MPDIIYKPEFLHEPFIEFVTRVSASDPETGFNSIFNRIEDEFDAISKVVDTIDNRIAKAKEMQRLELTAQNQITVPANGVLEESVDAYDRDKLPANSVKLHYVKIFPISGPKRIQYTFLYETLDENKVEVKLLFFNPGENETTFKYRVLSQTMLVEPQP